MKKDEADLDDARELRQQGIRAAKAGQKDEARQLLQQSLRIDPDSEPAWLWLASVANNNRERVFCLNKVLELNPNNETALKALQGLDEPPPPSKPSVPTARSTGTMQAVNAATAAAMEQPPGVPVPPPEKVTAALPELEKIARAYAAPVPKRANWQHKTRNRVGERDIVFYRLQVAAGVAVVVALLIIAGIFAVNTNDDLRAVVYGASLTPTPSPTITPTFTPGLSATPSSTPRQTPTPSATVPLNVPAASPPALPRATALYPPIEENFVRGALPLLEAGQVAQAVATLAEEREQNFGTTFNPDVYYYEAIGLARQGNINTALQRLAEADELTGERAENIRAIRPYLDSAYAQVYDLQARRLSSTGGSPAEALENMRVRAEAALEGDPRLEVPYLLLADDEAARNRIADAIDLLDRGLAVDDLAGNTNLMMAKARLLAGQRRFDEALYQLYLVHYVDPSVEVAYQLKYEIGLERNRLGDAVKAAQDYLYYYPGSTRAYRLLAEAYALEGKPEIALTIYDRGLSGRTSDDDTVAMLRARSAILNSLGQADRAYADYSRLLEITNDPQVRLLRMQAAVEAGRFADALEDADALAGVSGVDQGLAQYVRGRALVESGSTGDSQVFQQAQRALDAALASPALASPALRATALEYKARAQLEQRSFGPALETINEAIALADSVSRRYWRGRIHEAAGRDAAAALDYEFVVTWGAVLPFSGTTDAAGRLETIRATP